MQLRVCSALYAPQGLADAFGRIKSCEWRVDQDGWPAAASDAIQLRGISVLNIRDASLSRSELLGPAALSQAPTLPTRPSTPAARRATRASIAGGAAACTTAASAERDTSARDARIQHTGHKSRQSHCTLGAPKRAVAHTTRWTGRPYRVRSQCA
eukprot:6193759-Pleurochrysis_carterae.AAC.3